MFFRFAGLIALMLLSGCSTVVSYSPQKINEQQVLSYSQGVGAVSEKSTLQEIVIYPTFRTQGPERPTFNISFANNSDKSVEFGPENIRAFFRGEPVRIYSYADRIAEIRSQKQAKQVALAVLGGIAAGAAAYGASRQTYRQNYSGVAWNNRGYVAGFQGANTIRTYDPLSGIVAGGVVAGATVYGVNQLEYSANAEEEAANSILQMNTVPPQKMVSGELILRDCCDQFKKPNDIIRFDITVNERVSVFEFSRLFVDRSSSLRETTVKEKNDLVQGDETQPRYFMKTEGMQNDSRIRFRFEPVGLYNEPSQKFKPIRILKKDNNGIIKEVKGDWLLIEVDDPQAIQNRIDGWVLKNLVEKN